MDEEEEKKAEALLKKIRETVKSEQDALRKTVEVQGIELQRLKAGGRHTTSTGSPLLSIIESKKKDFENLLSGNAARVKFEIPSTVMKTLAETASITDSTQAYRLPGVGQLATPPMTLRSLFPSIDIGENSGGFVKYLDQETVDRGAATRAEKIEKPESAITWVEKSLPIRKITDTIPCTKELLTDFTQLARDVEQFLMTNVQLKVENQLATGDNIAPNLKGLFPSATAWPAYTGPAIDAANLFDLLIVMRAGLIAQFGGKYNPDFYLVNPIDLAALRLVKGTDEHYLMPSAIPMRPVESAEVAAGTLLIGDSRFGTVYTIGGTQIEVGLVGNQFIENKVTILAEERLALLVREVDANGFMKVADITAALANLVTPTP